MLLENTGDNMNKTNEEIVNKSRYNEIISRVGPHVIDIFQQFKNDLGGGLPAELSYGMVAGYLRGKGFTWEESFVGMNRHIWIMENSGAVGEVKEATMTIKGKEDGSVDIGIKE